MRTTIAITLLLLGLFSATAQDFMLVHKSDTILKYPVSPGVTTADIKSNTFHAVYDKNRSLYIVEDNKLHFSKADIIVNPFNATDNKIKKQLDNYAINMLIDYNENQDNLLVSPLSASTLYSMVSNFTDEQTMRLYLKNMGLEKFSIDQVNSCCVKLNEKIRKMSVKSLEMDEDETGKFIMENSVWLRQNDTIYNSFLNVSDGYNVNVKGIDLATGAGVMEATQSIRNMMQGESYDLERNSWDNVSSIVTSAMDFQYAWGNSVTDDWGMTFDNIDGTQTTCDFIYSDYDTPFGQFDNFDILEMPYYGNGNDNFSTYIVLPHEEVNLTQCLNDLKELGMDHYIDQMALPDEYTQLDIEIPMFKCEGVFGLNSQKQDIPYDIRQLYISNLPDVSPNGFKLDDIYQAYSIQFDQYGTSVKTETTEVIIDDDPGGTVITTGEEEIDPDDEPGGTNEPEIMVVDFHAVRPFAVFIKDKSTNFIAYACYINNLENVAVRNETQKHLAAGHVKHRTRK